MCYSYGMSEGTKTQPIECGTCSDKYEITCPACHGASWHWCPLDDAASQARDNDRFCGQPNGAEVAEPECDTCECSGKFQCPDCCE